MTEEKTAPAGAVHHLPTIKANFSLGQVVFSYDHGSDAVHRGRVVGFDIRLTLCGDGVARRQEPHAEVKYMVVWGRDIVHDTVSEEMLTAEPVFPEPPPNGKWCSGAPAADGWIEWHGGKCPVPVGTLVHVRVRGGGELEAADGSFLPWDHQGTDSDIVAYRVVREGGAPTVQADYDWIVWNGGQRPVPKKTIVHVKFRDGKIGPLRYAEDYRWEHIGSGDDAVAYRIASRRDVSGMGVAR